MLGKSAIIALIVVIVIVIIVIVGYLVMCLIWSYSFSVPNDPHEYSSMSAYCDAKREYCSTKDKFCVFCNLPITTYCEFTEYCDYKEVCQ